MKKIGILVLSLFVCLACSKDDDNNKSDAKAITAFTFTAADNNDLSKDIKAEIDEENKTITIVMPSDTDVTALKPEITISDKATIDPKEKVATNFTDDVTYTVTAEDGSTVKYTAATAISEREALIAFYNANKSAGGLNWNLNGPMSQWEGVTISDEGKVIALRFPYFSRNVEAIPPEIKSLVNLEDIFIVRATLKSIPAEIGKLKNLKSLTIANTNVETLPSEIGNLSNLVKLSISNNRITEIPTSIGNLSNLKTLFISRNPISKFTKEIAQLENLSELGLGHTQMETFPEEITQMTNLTGLYISGSKIKSIPKEIANLTKLIDLDLRENQLTTIPSELGALKDLESLILHVNRLTELPKEIGNLTKLKDLLIQSNQITSIPKEICDLNIENFQKDRTANCQK